MPDELLLGVIRQSFDIVEDAGVGGRVRRRRRIEAESVEGAAQGVGVRLLMGAEGLERRLQLGLDPVCFRGGRVGEHGHLLESDRLDEKITQVLVVGCLRERARLAARARRR